VRVGQHLKRLGHRPLISIVAVTVILAVSIALPVSAGALHNNPAGTPETADRATAGEPSATADGAMGGGPTLRVEDPVTGQIAPLPPGLAMEESVSTSDEGLVETQDAGGGTMVDVRGRFRSYMRVTRDAAGQISASCALEEKD
jgi:hypothetical protein